MVSFSSLFECKLVMTLIHEQLDFHELDSCRLICRAFRDHIDNDENWTQIADECGIDLDPKIVFRSGPLHTVKLGQGIIRKIVRKDIQRTICTSKSLQTPTLENYSRSSFKQFNQELQKLCVIDMLTYLKVPGIENTFELTNYHELIHTLLRITQLKKLSLGNFVMIKLDRYLVKLTELEELTLNRGCLAQLPTALRSLNCLTRISLVGHHIEVISVEEIEGLPKLEFLQLAHNNIRSFNAPFEHMYLLQTLDLTNNKLTSIPEAIGQLTNLKDLNLWGNLFEEIPETLFSLTKLDSLHLAYNRLTSLSNRVSNLVNLWNLTLVFNSFTTLPDLSHIWHFNQGYVSLDHMKFVEIPVWVSGLQKVEVIDLAHNRLTNQVEFRFYSTLRQLSLGSNVFEEWPSSTQGLGKLYRLNLGDNYIPTIPDQISGLVNLQHLDLSNNNIVSISPAVSLLPRLAHLNLTHNSISGLTEICRITSLNTLMLAHNEIEEIPSEIANLQKLFKLSISNNYITHFQDSLTRITTLQEADLRNNPINLVPVNVSNIFSF